MSLTSNPHLIFFIHDPQTLLQLVFHEWFLIFSYLFSEGRLPWETRFHRYPLNTNYVSHWTVTSMNLLSASHFESNQQTWLRNREILLTSCCEADGELVPPVDVLFKKNHCTPVWDFPCRMRPPSQQIQQCSENIAFPFYLQCDSRCRGCWFIHEIHDLTSQGNGLAMLIRPDLLAAQLPHNPAVFQCSTWFGVNAAWGSIYTKIRFAVKMLLFPISSY